MESFFCVPMAGALVAVGKDKDGFYMAMVYRGNQSKLANNRDSAFIKFKTKDINKIDVLVHDYDIVLLGLNQLMLIQEIYYVFVNQYQIFLEDTSNSFLEEYSLDSGCSNTKTVNNHIEAVINIKVDMISSVTIQKTNKSKSEVKTGILD